MRNPSEQEQVLINKRVSSYLIEEVFRSVLTSIVFIVLGVDSLFVKMSDKLGLIVLK